MIRNVIKVGALAGMVAALGACEKQLEVTNPNSPETRRVLAAPGDAEALLGGYYRRWHAGIYGGTGNVHGMANMLSLQNYSSLANNCQNARTPFTGVSNTNTPGNVCAGEQSSMYFTEGEVNRVASSILKQLADSTFTLGSTAQNARARSFAEFLRGLSLGYIALIYDSGAVISQDMSANDPGTLTDYKTMMDSAQAAFARAINIAMDTGAVSGSNGFRGTGNSEGALPSTWIPVQSTTSMTRTNFVRLIRSYRARLTVNVARTPAERAAPCYLENGTTHTCTAAMWDSVIADGQNGITADHILTTSTTTGPAYGWAAQYESFGTWHQMPAFIIGMAEGNSGSAYDAWVQTPIAQRKIPFFMVTQDQRFPQGGDRAAQNADFQISSCQAAREICKHYFVNRNPGGDQSVGEGWGFSNYDFVRFHSWRTAGSGGSAQNGDIVFFTKAENDLLQAEGQYRKGQYALAAGLVNLSRTGLTNATQSNGLGAIPALGGPVGAAGFNGGANCAADGVPKVPSGSGPSATLTCGGLWEALKYEKRIETAYTHFAAWFLDGRGWGDLPNGTPLYWHTPYQDLQSRGYALNALYGAGPTSGPGANPSNLAGSATTTVGTYGY